MLKRALISLVVAAMNATALGGQELSPTDRSVTASLLAVAPASPTGPAWMDRGFADTTQGGTRFDVTWGSAVRAMNRGRRAMVVLGARSETMQRFSGPIANPVPRETDEGSRADSGKRSGRMRGPGGGDGFASYAGARLGIRADSGMVHQPISAIELYAGGRSYGFAGKPYLPDVGMDFVVGWGGFGENTRASIAVRIPLELTLDGGGMRVMVFAAPAAAWGHIRTRECTDSDPYDDNDECPFFDRDIAFGRTRYIMSGGASIASERARLALSVGLQRLSSPGEVPRFWAGTSWTP